MRDRDEAPWQTGCLFWGDEVAAPKCTVFQPPRRLAHPCLARAAAVISSQRPGLCCLPSG